MIKSYIKLFIKKGLIVSRKTLAKSKTVRRAGRSVRAVLFPEVQPNIYNYSRYAPTIAEYQKQVMLQKEFKERPVISVVMPTYNTPIQYLEECIESVLIQSYPEWELCIADDASTNKEVIETIKKFAAQDKRVKLIERKENGHISAATNSAIEIASGTFIALLDHDDILWPNALFEIVKAINKDPKVDFLYSDEDKIDEASEIHSYPFFKPDWSPEFLESCNYITHFSVIKKSLVLEIGGFRIGYQGAQDWDVILRVTEKTSNIVHIPKLLYSWRIHEASTAKDTDAKPYVYEAQHKLLVDHVKRMGKKAVIKQGVIKQHSSIEYAIETKPMVSILIEVSRAKSLKKTLRSVTECTRYDNVEIILVPQNSSARHLCKQLVASRTGYKVANEAQNPTAALNDAANHASGEYLVFLEANLAVNTKHWVELLLGDAQHDGVGIVGGKVTNWQKDRFLRAAAATGVYGLYASLLEGMPLDDVHYMRGLYGQSRRNVSIVEGCIMIKTERFKQVGGFQEGLDDLFIGDFCLKLLKEGYRNIYNPFIVVWDQINKTAGDADIKRDKNAVLTFQKKWHDYIEYDPYFNPNFTRTNAQLDIK